MYYRHFSHDALWSLSSVTWYPCFMCTVELFKCQCVMSGHMGVGVPMPMQHSVRVLGWSKKYCMFVKDAGAPKVVRWDGKHELGCCGRVGWMVVSEDWVEKAELEEHWIWHLHVIGMLLVWVMPPPSHNKRKCLHRILFYPSFSLTKGIIKNRHPKVEKIPFSLISMCKEHLFNVHHSLISWTVQFSGKFALCWLLDLTT